MTCIGDIMAKQRASKRRGMKFENAVFSTKRIETWQQHGVMLVHHHTGQFMSGECWDGTAYGDATTMTVPSLAFDCKSSEKEHYLSHFVSDRSTRKQMLRFKWLRDNGHAAGILFHWENTNTTAFYPVQDIIAMIEAGWVKVPREQGIPWRPNIMDDGRLIRPLTREHLEPPVLFGHLEEGLEE